MNGSYYEMENLFAWDELNNKKTSPDQVVDTLR